MKYIIFLILLFFSIKIDALNYYVDNIGGNDANTGTSALFAWQTIEKVNATSFNPGDNIYFKRGLSWNTRLTIGSSGTSGNVIKYGAYSTGVNPQINGFETITGFTNEGGNIWSKTIPNAAPNLNTVYINGALRAKGRYPNSTFLTYIPTQSNQNLLKTSTVLGTNYTGMECVTRDAAFIYDVNRIIRHANDSIYLGACITSPYSGGTQQPGLTYDPSTLGTAARTQFFIQNGLSLLDVDNEWFWDSIPKKLYIYSTVSPIDVKVSTKDTLVYANHKDYITFDAVDIIGANKMGLGVDTCNYITHQNSTYNHIGAVAVDGRGSTHVTVTYDSIMNSFSNGIWFERAAKFQNINHNYIKNIGLLAGMGLSNNQRYMGIWSAGDTSNVRYNRIDSIGFNGIYIFGKRDTVYHNWITNFCFVKDDGGGIVTFGMDYSGALIRANIVQNGIGTGGDAAAGIYMDGNSLNIKTDSNTIEKTISYGIIINSADQGITLRGNTIVDSAAFGLYISPLYAPLEIKGNIIYAKQSIQGRGCVIAFSYGGSLVCDSNAYLCPTNEATKLKLGGNVPKTLAEWRLATTWDAHTTETPTGITAAQGRLIVNPTEHDSTTLLSGLYLDHAGVEYNNLVTISAFKSKLLFKADHEIITPINNKMRRYTFKLIQL